MPSQFSIVFLIMFTRMEGSGSLYVATYHQVRQSSQMQTSCGSREYRFLSLQSDSYSVTVSISNFDQQGTRKNCANTYIEAGRVKFRPKKPLSIPVSVTYA